MRFALLLVAACGSANLAGPGIPGGPVPVTRGVPMGAALVQTVDADGGTITLDALTVTIPPNAFPSPVSFSLQPVTATGLVGQVGSAYELDAGTAQPAVPVTLTFADAQAPSDTIAQLAAVGYWTRLYNVVRGAATVSAKVMRLTDYSLVTVATQRDLVGPVRLDSTQGPRFTVAGTLTLQYLAEGLYMPTGAVSVSAAGCTAPSFTLPVSLAELHIGKFRWGLDAQWSLSCGQFVSTNFDTLGITNMGCARSYTTAMPVNATISEISGQYLIDCRTQNGTFVEASWDFVPATGTPAALPPPQL